MGDFSFAIYDPRHKKLFCARDRYGMRPLYYHYSPGHFFLFGSSPKSILVLPKVPYKINDGRVADFLVGELEWIDYTSTFFEGVFRLPPGHSATVSATSLAPSLENYLTTNTPRAFLRYSRKRLNVAFVCPTARSARC